MSEPLSGGIATWIVAASAALGVAPQSTFGVVCGAFLGSTVLVLSPSDQKPIFRLLYMLISLLCGMMLSNVVSGFLSKFLAINVPDGVGALFASVVIVGLLQWLIKAAKNPLDVFKQIRENLK